MALLLMVCQLILSVVLIFASISKFQNIEKFAKVLRVSGVHQGIAPVVAFVVPALELICSVAIILSPIYILVFFMTITMGMFVLFTIWLYRIYVRNISIECGCFGKNSQYVNRYTFLKNLVLILINFIAVAILLYKPNILIPVDVRFGGVLIYMIASMFSLVLLRKTARKQMFEKSGDILSLKKAHVGHFCVHFH